MTRRGRIASWASAPLALLLAAMVVLAVIGVPRFPRANTVCVACNWHWNMPQSDAWNPYDCRFWQNLPPAETIET